MFFPFSSAENAEVVENDGAPEDGVATNWQEPRVPESQYVMKSFC